MTLRGSTSDFPLESVIGLLAGTSKTGELQVRGNSTVGALGFAGGRLVAAVMEGEGGENALGAIFAITQAEFEFTPWESAPDANLEGGDLVSILKRAADARDRITAIRESIPDDHMRFKLSERAADQGAITFTPDRWRALLAVNGERDVAAIAEQLRLGKMQALSLLSGLVKDGVVEALPPAENKPAEAPPAYSAPEPSAPGEPEPAPPAEAWSPPPAREEESAPTQDWSSSATAQAWQEIEPAKEEPSQPAQDWSTSAPDWTVKEPETPPFQEGAPPPEVHDDLQAEIAQRMEEFGPPAEQSAPGVEVPPAIDDRLASLSGLFAPGPAANAPARQAPSAEGQEKPKEDDWWRAPGGATSAHGGPAANAPAESWMTAPPASKEAPANAWAPTAKPKEVPNANPWGAPATEQAPPATDTAAARADEWAPPPQERAVSDAIAEKDKKKSGGFLSRFRKEETPTPIAHIEPASPSASKIGKLASLSNALLMEYNSGGYGKGKIETRLAHLLMRVDEQADPIDRPLPIVDDLIDAAALEREGFDEQQAVPYLATLVRQIYEDAERAFGKDKAKKGYKAAQQQVFGGDANALQSPELAGKLPQGLSLYLGIDLGASNIRSVIARDEQPIPRIIARDERPTPRTGAADVIASIAESARTALATMGTSPRDLAGAACSAPGPLNHISGIVYDAPNINGFANVHLAEGLAKALGIESVFLDRDTVMAAIGEGLAGAAKGVPDYVYVTISTGIGGALVSGGRMLRGVNNIAGEIGHWPVALEGPRCGCGSYGCVESLAAGRFLAEAYGVDDAARVYAGAASGDPKAVAILARAEAALGNLAITLVNGLNPSLIVVGGSVAEHEPAHTLEPMRRAIATRAFRVAADAVRVIPAALGRDVGMLGAVISVRERLAGRAEWFL